MLYSLFNHKIISIDRFQQLPPTVLVVNTVLTVAGCAGGMMYVTVEVGLPVTVTVLVTVEVTTQSAAAGSAFRRE